MWQKRTNTAAQGHLLGGVAAVVTITIAALLFFNRQYVIDQLTVWQYRPSSDIAALATRTDMNSGGMFLFYASQPSIEDADTFNKQCGKHEASTAILGCYNGTHIYIYNVTDTRLDGIRDVTAAHEMLHAAYARMNSSQKSKINTLLEAEYAKLKDDKQFAERMAFYARTEPGERDNELHSVIGTEVASISQELEDHYKKYFNNRSKVVALHDAYAKVFSDLQAKSDTLLAQLTELKNKIETESLTYNKDVNELNSDIALFNARASNGGFANQAVFDAERSDLVKRANVLDETRQDINSKVSRYETLRQELASVASQSDALNKSIDSSLVPAPSL